MCEKKNEILLKTSERPVLIKMEFNGEVSNEEKFFIADNIARMIHNEKPNTVFIISSCSIDICNVENKE